MIVALVIGLLTAAGVYLILHRGLIRVIIGFVLLGHAVNVLLLAAGGLWRREPPLGGVDPDLAADPLPQAFALTAIVITFGITVYLLALAQAGPADAGRPDLELGEVGPDVGDRHLPRAEPDQRAGPADRRTEPVLTEPVLTEPVLTEPRSFDEETR